MPFNAKIDIFLTNITDMVLQRHHKWNGRTFESLYWVHIELEFKRIAMDSINTASLKRRSGSEMHQRFMFASFLSISVSVSKIVKSILSINSDDFEISYVEDAITDWRQFNDALPETQHLSIQKKLDELNTNRICKNIFFFENELKRIIYSALVHIYQRLPNIEHSKHPFNTRTTRGKSFRW